MLTFYTVDGETAILKIVIGKQSKGIAAIQGCDCCSIDDYFNEVSTNPEAKHTKLCVTYCDDERDAADFLNMIKYNQLLQAKNKNTEDKTEQPKKENKKQKCINYTCPKCGSQFGLVDKDGNTYPCISCLKIDIGSDIYNTMFSMKKIKKSKTPTERKSEDDSSSSN